MAVRRDVAGRELLTWALAKVAAAGDRVVTLHVATADGSGTEERSSAASTAAELLASVLAAYDSFCSLNQVLLDFTPAHGRTEHSLLPSCPLGLV